MRKLVRVDLLILDDFCLQAFGSTDTADIYELVVERHRATSTVVTSNREPIEWLGLMADRLLARSATTGSSSPPTSSCSKESPDHPPADAGPPREPVPSLALGWVAVKGAVSPGRGRRGVSRRLASELAEGWSLTAGGRHQLPLTKSSGTAGISEQKNKLRLGADCRLPLDRKSLPGAHLYIYSTSGTWERA